MSRFFAITAAALLVAMSLRAQEPTPTVVVSDFAPGGGLAAPVAQPKLVLNDEAWRSRLTPKQYMVARGKGTEPRFCSGFLDNKKEGTYACVCCGLPLFASSAKYHSGTGWPSFIRPVADGNVVEQRDLSHGMVRTEILCARCDAHLGHVFDDGPEPTGLRYCVNGESLRFIEAESPPRG